VTGTGGASIHRFRVGRFECVALDDGTIVYTADQYFANAPPEELAAALARHGLERDRIPSPYTCLLVDTGSHRVVIDTGGAGLAPGVGRFAESFAATGVDPGDVDWLVLTHGHPDHIGGNLDASGEPRFPEARVAMWSDEWEYWTSEPTLAGDPFADTARRNLPPLRDRMELFTEEAEIVPGVRALPAPGHTVGHMAVAVQSDGEELLYISDAALHPLHLEHPDWLTVFEADPARALDSRRRLCERAATTGALVLAFHFDPFPSLGRIRTAPGGWTWQPVLRSG